MDQLAQLSSMMSGGPTGRRGSQASAVSESEMQSLNAQAQGAQAAAAAGQSPGQPLLQTVDPSQFSMHSKQHLEPTPTFQFPAPPALHHQQQQQRESSLQPNESRSSPSPALATLSPYRRSSLATVPVQSAANHGSNQSNAAPMGTASPMMLTSSGQSAASAIASHTLSPPVSTTSSPLALAVSKRRASLPAAMFSGPNGAPPPLPPHAQNPQGFNPMHPGFNNAFGRPDGSGGLPSISGSETSEHQHIMQQHQQHQQNQQNQQQQQQHAFFGHQQHGGHLFMGQPSDIYPSPAVSHIPRDGSQHPPTMSHASPLLGQPQTPQHQHQSSADSTAASDAGTPSGKSKSDGIKKEPKTEFPCPHPGCGKIFQRNHNLKSHMLTHSDEKPFTCTKCDMSFRRNHDLRRHYRLHSGVKPYVCQRCDKRFSRSDALRRHVKVEACVSGVILPLSAPTPQMMANMNSVAAAAAASAAAAIQQQQQQGGTPQPGGQPQYMQSMGHPSALMVAQQQAAAAEQQRRNSLLMQHPGMPPQFMTADMMGMMQWQQQPDGSLAPHPQYAHLHQQQQYAQQQQFQAYQQQQQMGASPQVGQHQQQQYPQRTPEPAAFAQQHMYQNSPNVQQQQQQQQHSSPHAGHLQLAPQPAQQQQQPQQQQGGQQQFMPMSGASL